MRLKQLQKLKTKKAKNLWVKTLHNAYHKKKLPTVS